MSQNQVSETIFQEYDYEKAKLKNVKKQMEEIYDILNKEKEDLRKKEIQTLEMTKKQVSKEKEFKTLSFNSVIARPPFIFAPKKKEFFDPDLPKTFMDTGKVLDFSEREALIFPERVNAKKLKNIYSSCLAKSDIPKEIPINKMSQKEIEYKKQWNENYEKLKQQELHNLREKDDGVLKSKICKEMLQKSKYFKPNPFKPDFFEKNPSNISDMPRTHSVVERMISLERNFEKKHWRPNRMVLDLFEKPKQTYDFTQKITKKYSEKSL